MNKEFYCYKCECNYLIEEIKIHAEEKYGIVCGPCWKGIQEAKEIKGEINVTITNTKERE